MEVGMNNRRPPHGEVRVVQEFPNQYGEASSGRVPLKDGQRLCIVETIPYKEIDHDFTVDPSPGVRYGAEIRECENGRFNVVVGHDRLDYDGDKWHVGDGNSPSGVFLSRESAMLTLNTAPPPPGVTVAREVLESDSHPRAWCTEMITKASRALALLKDSPHA